MLTPTGTLPPARPWRCPRCEAARAAEDDFCGRCGARRPPEAVRDPDAAADDAAAAKGGFPVVRALALNGIVLGAVVVALVLGRSGGGPTTITFEPTSWRCDGSARTWIAAIPESAEDVRLDWMTGGPVGSVRATSTIATLALDLYRQTDGTYRVTTTATDSPECGLDPGPYTLAIRDAASNALLASGNVELVP
jgi:hypothetical protein